MYLIRIAACVVASFFITAGLCKRVYKPVSDEEAKKYLHTFGYVGTSNMLNASPNSRINSDLEETFSSLKNAIKKFQEFAGLRPTGELDDSTKKKMAEPRCGVTDVLAISKGANAFAWDRTDLTYSIESYSPDLPRDQIKKVMSQAFHVWSEVSPLNFKEVPKNGDIKIRFSSKEHGDPWPFDGTGGVLAHATFPKSGMLHFDEDESWTFKDAKKLGSYLYTDLLSVAIHEAGHTLGLDHSRDESAIMAPFYQDAVDRYGNYITPKLTKDDIRSIQDIYGPRKGSLPKEPSEEQHPSLGPRITLGPAISDDDEMDKPSFSHGDSGHGRFEPWKPPRPSTDRVPSGFDDSSNAGNFGCPYDVDSVTTVREINYLFSSTKVYEFDGNKVVKVHSLRKLFPMSPPFTQGAFTNPDTGMTYLLQGSKIYGYTFQNSQQAFKLSSGYPKKLPSSLKFNPMGAFKWVDDRPYLFNANNCAVYDDNKNRIILQGRVSDYFTGFPRLDPVRGAISSGRNMLIFTNRNVFEYDVENSEIKGNLRPLEKYLNC